MSEARKLAEKLFRDDHPITMPYAPYAARPQLSDLWPCDQQKYLERAERELLRRTDHE